MRWIITGVAALLSAAPIVAGEPALLGAAVSLIHTPGEPGAPTQTLTAARHGETFTLKIQIDWNGDGQSQKSETRPLTADEFGEVWEIVTIAKLRTWLPDESAGSVSDWGERRLRVEWTTEASGRPQVHEVAWAREPTNGEGVGRLRAALSALVRLHVRDVTPIVP